MKHPCGCPADSWYIDESQLCPKHKALIDQAEWDLYRSLDEREADEDGLLDDVAGALDSLGIEASPSERRAASLVDDWTYDTGGSGSCGEQ